jgi:hypothetical protein
MKKIKNKKHFSMKDFFKYWDQKNSKIKLYIFKILYDYFIKFLPSTKIKFFLIKIFVFFIHLPNWKFKSFYSYNINKKLYILNNNRNNFHESIIIITNIINQISKRNSKNEDVLDNFLLRFSFYSYDRDFIVIIDNEIPDYYSQYKLWEKIISSLTLFYKYLNKKIISYICIHSVDLRNFLFNYKVNLYEKNKERFTFIKRLNSKNDYSFLIKIKRFIINIDSLILCFY